MSKVEKIITDKDVIIGRTIFKKGVTVYKCKCGEFVRPNQKFCHECGDALDWSE